MLNRALSVGMKTNMYHFRIISSLPAQLDSEYDSFRPIETVAKKRAVDDEVLILAAQLLIYTFKSEECI